MRSILTILLTGVIMAGGLSCGRPGGAAGDLPEPEPGTLAPTDGDLRSVVFAGGCFWCVEAVFQEINGVSKVVSGYAGGTADTAVYDVVASGGSDHAEAIRITFDPKKVSYGQLLKVFFTSHDPTTLNRQGPDSGRQYRSAIFYADEAEKAAAKAYIEKLEESDVFGDPVVTTLEPLERFYPAEASHQDFVERNPSHPYVRVNALPKVEKAREKFPDLLK